MSNPSQYLAVVEETTRGTTPGSGHKFLPITGKIMPEPKFDDKAKDEFRGQSTALGNASASLRRFASSWAMGLEVDFYAGAEVGLLFKHAFGHVGAAQTIDTNAKGKLLYPEVLPYGTGMALVDKAVAVIPNVDISGTTKAQIFGGGRCKGFEITCKRPDDVKLKFDIAGGPWVGAPGQTAIGSPSFPAAATVFNSADLKCYIGAGATRTGSAPDFTLIAPNTMTQFTPDDLTVKFENGLDDEDVLDNKRGPSKTTRKGKVKATVEFSMDFLDPATGFSSYDEFAAYISAVRTNSLMFVLDNGTLIGAATQNYQAIIDLPLVQVMPDTPDISSDGKQGKVKFKCETLVDVTIGYPLALWLVDLAASY